MDMDYAYALDQGKLIFKLKTAKDDLSQVLIYYTDKYLHGYGLSDVESMIMDKVGTYGQHDYYEVELDIRVIALRYFFQVKDKEGKIGFLGDYGFMDAFIEDPEKMYVIAQQSKEEDGFVIPDWMNHALIYQIFPERFYRGKERLNNHEYQDWDSQVRWDSRLGGSIAGIREKLAYIKELGVTVIYLNPIFLSPSNHKYDTTDYFEIDPSFGTKEEFKALVDEIHNLGMYLVIDGVFNHCGYDFFAFQDVVHKGAESRYADWFTIHSFPVKFGRDKNGKPMKPNYETFGYYGGMPKLNMKSQEVRDYIFKLTRYWTETFGIDGWRLDASDEVSYDFWRAFRKHVKSISDQVGLIGEIWYDASTWLQGDQYDSVMNYKFRNPVLDFIGLKKTKASIFGRDIQYSRCIYNRIVQPGLWNLIGSHDTARFLTLCNADERRLKLAVMIQMTMTGSPVIYYGDEVGMTGGDDPGCRMGMVWDKEKQNLDLLHYYKELIGLFKKEEALHKGTFSLLFCDDTKGLILYLKSYMDQRIIVAINNGDKIVDLSEADKSLVRELSNGQVLSGPGAMKIGPYEGAIIKVS